MTTQELQAALDRLDKGLLLHGSHKPGSEQFCALEFESQVRGRQWSDAPITLPDMRPLNDAPWSSDKARTDALLPVMAALWGWAEWTPKRRQRWASIVAIETVKRIVSTLPNLTDAIRTQCINAEILPQAAEAAEAAAEAAEAVAEAAWAAAEAAEAAEAAARAARAAAEAAARAAAEAAAADSVLTLACQIWIDAAEKSLTTT